jgi:hypothetical protein
MLLSPGSDMFVFSVLWVLWLIVGIVVLVVFCRGMIALAKIPDRLERIERALAREGASIHDRAT